MATKNVWSGVSIAVQSALASAITVGAGGVTKANPAVATYTGTDPSNGDYLYLSSFLGMTQLDERVVRAANVNAGGNTVELEGVDSTLYDTMVSGNMQVITFGTTLNIVTGMSGSGGEFEFIDATLVHDTVRSRIPGVASPISLDLTCIWDPSDAGLLALKSASDAKAKRAIRVGFSGGAKFLFVGYVGCTVIPTGNAQELVTTRVQIEGQGRATAYST